MNLNNHGLPVLPARHTPRPRTECQFNFEGNRVFAFLSIQAYQSEIRTQGKVDRHTRAELEQGQSHDLW